MKSGIVILAELHGPIRDRILEIQRRFDPKLAKSAVPHVTITGSSGMGPIATRTTVPALREALAPIARETPRLTLQFMPPQKFMQTDIVVLPLDPNGAIRTLHERIKKCGLKFEQERFTFTPHATLTFFKQLSHDEVRALLGMRINEPVVIDRIAAYRTMSITNTKKLVEFKFGV